MKAKLTLMLFLLFFSQAAFAEEEILEEETLVIQARLTVIDNNVLVDSIQLIYGYPSESEEGANHIAKLMDKELSTVYQIGFYLEEFVPTMPESLTEEEIDEYYENAESVFEAVLYFPYFEDAALLTIGEENNGLMALIDLEGRLCNIDGECSENENSLGCPEDCPLEESDDYCFPETDGVCDPDCIEGIDPDCEEKEEEKDEEKEREEYGIDFSQYYLIGAIALIMLVIIGYNLVKKRGK